jgi:hypothetical protein
MVRRRISAIASGACLMLVVMAGPVLAQTPPPHDHWLTVPGTGVKVQVGPHRCGLGDTVQKGFLNFHVNVHVGQPGVEITATLC